MTAVFYHNPRCSKSREALKLLTEQGVSFEVVEYLNHPPTKEKLEMILAALEKAPLEIIRTKDSLFKELGLVEKHDRPASEWLDILLKYPQLMERPIFVKDKRAVVGRPPEKVLEII